MACGVYKIINTVNGKIYVGSSVDIRGRFNSHKSDLRQNKHGNSKLQNAWNKYGEECFVFEIAEECDPQSVRDIEQVYLNEIFSKADKQSFYNLYPNATGLSSEQAREQNLKRWSDPEFKARASASFKKTWSDPELLARHAESCKDNIKKIANPELWMQRNKDSHNTEEYITKSSERTRQQWQDPEIRSKMISSLTSEESRAKKSASIKAAYEDEEVKHRHREGIKKSMTDERRANLSKYSKDYYASPESRAKQALIIPHRKSIMCNETGEIYVSISDAAKKIGVCVKSIKKATKPGRTCKGLTFKYI
jgi:hypothetical protein